MSLNSIMNIGVSGLQTAQEQLRVVSDNITNVNTPGYIRKVANQQTVTAGGSPGGVTAGQVKLAADQFLEQQQFKATSASSQADASYNLLDQIQAQFGDLTDTNGIFNQASATLTAAAQAAEDPTSSASRQAVVADLQSFLSTGSQIAGKIQDIRTNADQQIASDVGSINDILKNIANLNTQISSGTATGSDITAAQTSQATAIQSLSKLVDVSVSTNSNGGVTVRTQSGLVLVNDATPVSLSYQPASSINATTSFNPIIVTGANGENRDLADSLSSGELKGLIDVRDNTSVAVNDQLNQYMGQFANALNTAHNAASAVPAPASLTGKNLAQTVDEGVIGFTGETNFVTLDTSGNITHKLTVDFNPAGDGTGTWSMDNGASTGTFGATTFDTDLTNAFSAAGSGAKVTFSNGTLSFASNSTTEGVAVTSPAAGSTPAPATKVGQGFSQFFGLNDLVTSTVPTTNNTGLTATSNAGFTSGGTVGFALRSPAGALLGAVNFTMPTSGDMTNLVNQLNDTNTGVGRYGTFSLDPNGALTFKGFGNPSNTMSITSDTTARLTSGGPSFGQFFGLSGNASTVAQHLTVNSVIAADPNQLALAQVNLAATPPQANLLPADGSGGTLLSNAANAQITFAKTGLNGGGVSTLDRYGADLAGQVGNLSSQAKSNKDAADSLLTEATSRRSSAEGVNLDEELVNLTTYQQAYSASGRLVQAASDMFTTLLNMMGT